MTDSQYVAHAIKFIRSVTTPGSVFSANELRALGVGDPTSGNRRLLGNALVKMKMSGDIRRVSKVRSHNGHGQTVSLWERVA